MDTEDNFHAEHMVVQVTVTAGGDVGVELTTAAKILRSDAPAQIGKIVKTLLNSVPMNDLLSTEHLYRKDLIPVVMPDGSMRYVTPELERAIIEQREMKKRMEKNPHGPKNEDANNHG
jgi:hypothetical protein